MVVFSRGNPGARLMVIGRGPRRQGRCQERQAPSWAGLSGQLLDQMLRERDRF